ncbi:ATP synthase F1 subunit gamma [Helicobacter sp. MIT 14-3879]|uniref:ATP synthase F1 subunit gamma n=1 Tax=Helicobacter sp. MIT 14-3879 TaxID=2040649 RepID=UPI000E1F2F66|nr:ATP synthase F1 subunit gamma [Helicobacter sp. MIT 14-3879]RDU63166.1 F0F1 ATP synthase subunit gamma [Helicobacter sp. MIT 14-3879]
MGNSLKEIRKEIASIKNIQKTTRAMKLVANSKLKKAVEAAKRSKIYARKLNEVFNDIIQKTLSSGNIFEKNDILFVDKNRVVKMVDIIFVTSDKGLCGAFNSNTIKAVVSLMNEYKNQDIKIRIRGIGKTGIRYFNFNEIELYDKSDTLSSNPSDEQASIFIMNAVNDYINGVTDKVIIVYNGFKNMLTQEVKITEILPFKVDLNEITNSKREMGEMLIEPIDNEKNILEELAKQYINYNMFYSLIDSLAAELSARMQAMDTATKNASELVRELTIKHNKARQAAITTELVEINAGVEAMK